MAAGSNPCPLISQMPGTLDFIFLSLAYNQSFLFSVQTNEVCGKKIAKDLLFP